MTHLTRACGLAVLLGGLAWTGGAAGRAADEPTESVRVLRDITYATVAGQKLQLDLALPPGDGPFPCVLLLHGGAWMAGSRAECSGNGRDRSGRPTPSWIEKLARHGYAAAAADYRLAPAHPFPAMIQDARAAIRFLRAHAQDYHLDPKRFAAGGFSAGAHLALLCGYCDRSAGFDVGDHLEHSGPVQCVISFFGPTDLTLYAATPSIEDGYLVPVFGKAAKTDPTVYKRASPLSYVRPTSPPTLLLHGNLDLIVPIAHSQRLYRALKDAGVPAELVTIPFGNHGGWGERDLARATAAVVRFLDTHLKGKRP